MDASTGSFTLSRSSRLYKFVFGKSEWKLEGFPEPRNSRIPLGLFIGLLLAVAVMRPLGYGMFLLMDALLKIVAFLIDGSYASGSVLGELGMKKIEPWPRVRGRRLSPWFLLALIVIAYQYWYVGVKEAGEFLLFFTFITVVFLCIKADEKSPSMQLAEAVGPVMDNKLRLAYYKEPKLLPSLELVY